MKSTWHSPLSAYLNIDLCNVRFWHNTGSHQDRRFVLAKTLFLSGVRVRLASFCRPTFPDWPAGHPHHPDWQAFLMRKRV